MVLFPADSRIIGTDERRKIISENPFHPFDLCSISQNHNRAQRAQRITTERSELSELSEAM